MKRKKNLILLLAVLVLLVGSVFAVTALNREAPENDSIQDLDAVIFTADSTAVTKLSWNYSEEVSFIRTDAGWEYAADPAFELNESYITSMLNTVSSISASKVIEKVEDWDQYGLAVPVCTVTITTDTDHTLSFGSESAIGGQRYFSIGDGNAYLVDSACINPFAYGLYDLLILDEIPAMDTVTGIEVNTASGKLDITYAEYSGKSYSDSYIWFLDDRALDTELTDALVDTVTAVEWEKCSNFNAVNLATYGLEEPTATVTVHYLDAESAPATFTLEIGNAAGDSSYAKLADSTTVYLIDGSIRDALLNASYNTLMPDDILAMDWSKLQSMEITMNGSLYELVQASPAAMDAEGNVTRDAVYSLNGETVAAAGIPAALDAMTSVGYATGVIPERNEEVRFLFHQENSAYPTVSLVFYQYDGETCLVTLNDESTVFVPRAQVVDLTEAVTQMLLG